MINSLPYKLSEINNIASVLFADNSVIWTSTPHNNHLKPDFQMNEGFTKLSDWCAENDKPVYTVKSTTKSSPCATSNSIFQ
jgi:hypothetical protein